MVVVMNDNGCEVECGGSDGGKDDEEDSDGDDELDTSPADALWCVSEALVMLHFFTTLPICLYAHFMHSFHYQTHYCFSLLFIMLFVNRMRSALIFT